MKMNQKFLILCVFAVSCVITIQAEAQYSVSNSMFGNGYTSQTNSNYQLKGTLGHAISQKEIIINEDESKLLLTGFNSSSLIPTRYELSQNYPNPFNATTTIQFGLPIATKVKIDIFNITGQHMKTILESWKPAGFHTIKLNAQNMTSGIYMYRIQAGDFVQTKKMILMK